MYLFPKPKRGPRGLYPSTSELASLPLWTVGVCVLGVFLWNLAGQGAVSKIQAAEHEDGVAFTERTGELNPGHWVGGERFEPDAGLMSPGRTDASTGRHGIGDGKDGTAGGVSGEVAGDSLDQGAMVTLGRESNDWVPRDDGRQFSRGRERNGKRVGMWETVDANGQPRSKGRYEDGRREGRWQFWSESGDRDLTGEYREGKRHGAWSGWHPNGSRRSDQTYSEGRPSGIHTLWYSNGQVKETGLFVLGLRQGLWRYYDFAGNVDMRTGTYVDGQRVTDGR